MNALVKNILTLSRDAMAVVEKRYNILRSISYLQPIGRRQLASYMGYTEREIRSEIEYLRTMGLIRVEPSGMILTINGIRLLEEMLEYIPQLTDKSEIENQIKDLYGIKAASIVSGDVNTRALIHREMGQRAALELAKLLPSVNTVALTGHFHVGYMAEAKFPDMEAGQVLFCPVRTAQMNDDDLNANSYCAQVARKIRAKYMLLHLGKDLSINEIEKRYNEPDVIEVLNRVKAADIMVTGVTPLNKSQLFKSMSLRAQDSLLKSEPCCELLGSFLKKDGKQVNNPPLYSLSIDQIAEIPTLMLIGGGNDYIDGIIALSLRFRNIHLITDEATASHLITLKNLK